MINGFNSFVMNNHELMIYVKSLDNIGPNLKICSKFNEVSNCTTITKQVCNILNNKENVVQGSKNLNYQITDADFEGNTILHRAALQKNAVMIKEIMNDVRGSTLINKGNRQGETPLYLVLHSIHNIEQEVNDKELEVIKILLKYGANPNIIPRSNCQGDKIKWFKYDGRAGGRVKIKEPNPYVGTFLLHPTPIAIVANKKCADLVLSLLRHGASTDGIKNKDILDFIQTKKTTSIWENSKTFALWIKGDNLGLVENFPSELVLYILKIRVSVEFMAGFKNTKHVLQGTLRSSESHAWHLSNKIS